MAPWREKRTGELLEAGAFAKMRVSTWIGLWLVPLIATACATAVAFDPSDIVPPHDAGTQKVTAGAPGAGAPGAGGTDATGGVPPTAGFGGTPMGNGGMMPLGNGGTTNATGGTMSGSGGMTSQGGTVGASGGVTFIMPIGLGGGGSPSGGPQGAAGACNPLTCPFCPMILQGPPCCTPAGKCGCPAALLSPTCN